MRYSLASLATIFLILTLATSALATTPAAQAKADAAKFAAVYLTGNASAICAALSPKGLKGFGGRAQCTALFKALAPQVKGAQMTVKSVRLKGQTAIVTYTLKKGSNSLVWTWLFDKVGSRYKPHKDLN